MDKYPLDVYSISHLNAGIITYYIGFFLFNFFINPLAAVFLSYICALVGGLVWEFYENIFIIEEKRNKRQDSPINSLTDVILVFFGSIIGAYTYDLWYTNWIFNVILVGSLLAAYGVGRIITEKNIFK